jgi:thiamine biosynthesis lipoprotein ApbE
MTIKEKIKLCFQILFKGRDINMELQVAEEKGKEIVADAFELCKNYEDKMSKTIKGSDVYKVNNAGGKAVSVSDETKEVIEMAKEACVGLKIVPH